MIKTDDVTDVLENPTYVAILLCIINGENYAMAISKTLEKRQPTVTEQLKELERVGLIKALKRRKAQCYEVNWDLLLDVFYGAVSGILELREKYLAHGWKRELALIKKVNLQGIIPKALVEVFLKEYFTTFLAVGGKAKGFDEIIFSFFAAIYRLSKSKLRKLAVSAGIDEKVLLAVAHAAEFELYGTEIVALENVLDTVDNDKSTR